MDAQLVKKIVYQLTGEHITDKQRALLELIALVLKERNHSAGLTVFIKDMYLVAVPCRKRAEGKTAKACADNVYFHFTFSAFSSDFAALFSVS